MASTLSTVIASSFFSLSLLSILAMIIFARLFVSFLHCLVEANGRIRFDQLLVGWTDSHFRDLHVHSNPNVTVSTR
jgi:hypothetical protein